ncbi:MAG: MBL fold metallo-hydrolase, partial [bacterium]
MQIKFIGTEDGRGIPSAGCQCERCNIARDKGGKDYRSRVSIIVSNGSETILYDTPSTIGSVLNEERIFHISAIFLSHKHFDHIGGITEFEYWPHIIPVYGNISVLGNFEITDGLLFRQDGKRIVHFNDKADQETFKKIARWAYLFESMDADRIK